MEIESAVSLVPVPNMRSNTLAVNALNSDIIKAMAELVPEATKDVQQLAQTFKKPTTKQTAFAIWHFLRTRAKYVRDSSDLQQIRLPRRFIFDTHTKKNSGDCKSFALLAVSILRALNLPAYFRYAGYLPDKNQASHVYAFTKDASGNEIIIDGCYPFFNREKKFFYHKNDDMTVTSLSGVNDDLSESKRKAKHFLAMLSPGEKAAFMKSYRRRCKRMNIGRQRQPGTFYNVPTFQSLPGSSTALVQDSGQPAATGAGRFKRRAFKGLNGADESNPLGDDVLSDNFPVHGADESSPIAKKHKEPKLSKEERKKRRKARNAKALRGLKKFGKGLLFGVSFLNLLPIRAAFNSIVAMNVNSFAHNLRFLYNNRNGKTKEEWKKVQKIWQRVGGIEKALLKAIQLGSKHKPLFLSKGAKKKFAERSKNNPGYSGCNYIGDVAGIGNPAIIAAAVAAASGIIAALIPVVMKGLQKGGAAQAPAAAAVAEQGQQMVQEYKAQGSPPPQPYKEAAPGQTGADGSQEEAGAAEEAAQAPEDNSEAVEGFDGVGAFDFSALTTALGQIATVGIQTAGAAVAIKRAKNPQYNQVISTSTPQSEQYFTGKYLEAAGDKTGAKTYPKKPGKRPGSGGGLSTKTMLLIGGGLLAALAGVALITRKK